MARYTDGQIIAILQKAARRVNRRLHLTDTTDEIVVDDTGVMTSPTGDNSEDLEDILLLQAECLISTREYHEDISEGNAGILVRDGEQLLDDRTGAVARGTFYNGPHSPCEELVAAIKLEQIRRLGYNGKLVW